MPNKITIEQLKEGFLVEDNENERYAVLSIVPWIVKYFGVPEDKESKKKN
jgi:hypothetical protein